jgi:hypothetical protein
VEHILIVYDAPLALDATDYFYTRYRNTTMGSVIDSSALQNAFPIPAHQLSAHDHKRKLTFNPSSSLICRATSLSTSPGSFCLLSLSTKTGLGFGVGVQASFLTLLN